MYSFEALQNYVKKKGYGYFSIPLSEKECPGAPLEGLLYSNGIVIPLVLKLLFA